MAIPTKTFNPLRPLGIIALVAGALILVILVVIWQATRPMFSTSSTTGMMQWNGSARSVATTDAYEANYVGVKMMQPIVPVPTPAPGASPEERATVGEKVIRTGSLTMRVDDATKRLAELRALTETAGGFVASANTTDRNGVKTAYATVRIPNDKFREVVEATKRLASTVFDENETGEDVTAQYVDLGARLNAAKAEETQYLDILKRASTIEDTLNVTARLGEVRSRIEQMEGQMRFLNDRTTYATLSVTLTEEAKVEIPSRVWKPGETFNLALRALTDGLQAFADLLITGGVFLIGFVVPVLLVVCLVAWIVWRIVKRILKK